MDIRVFSGNLPLLSIGIFPQEVIFHLLLIQSSPLEIKDLGTHAGGGVDSQKSLHAKRNWSCISSRH